jgi:hypothetical protein
MAPAGYNVFAILRSSLDRAGWFDESIYPAFCEDAEWEIRTSKLHKPFKVKTYKDVYGVHGAEQLHGYESGISLEGKHGENISFVMKRHPLNCNYVRRKWGCASEKVKSGWQNTCIFGTPFNISGAHVSAWYNTKLQRHQDHHLSWHDGRGVVDQRTGDVLFALPESYGSWSGFTYPADAGCPLTGVLGRKNASTCI